MLNARRRWELLAGLVLAGALAGCAPEATANTIRVDLRTDYTPGVEFDVVRLEVGEGDLAFRSDHLFRSESNFVRGERINETMAAPGPTPLRLTLYRAGAAVATRRVSVFITAPITVVTVVMTRSCEGVECPNDNPLFDSCLGGECVDPRCTVETPEFCPVGSCTGASECDAVDCADPRCEANSCFSIPDDSRCGDGERCDAILGCTPVGVIRDAGIDAEPLDGGPDTFDTGTDVFDAGNDAGPPTACPSTDDDTVFLFDFESATDEVTGMSGILDGARLVAGDSPCGFQVLEIATGLSHFRIPDRSSFQLSSGSIDFWIKAPIPTGWATILDRDASGTELPGHIGIYYTDEGEIVVRYQEVAAPEGGACSGTGSVPPGTWARVGVVFGSGGIQIYINGTRRSRTGSYDFGSGTIVRCDGLAETGIAGNFNPFVLGANSGTSDEGSHVGLRLPFTGLQLDQPRLSSVRRDYESETYP